MSVTGLNDQGLYQTIKIDYTPKLLQMLWFSDLVLQFWKMVEFFYISDEYRKCAKNFDIRFCLVKSLVWYFRHSFGTHLRVEEYEKPRMCPNIVM